MVGRVADWAWKARCPAKESNDGMCYGIGKKIYLETERSRTWTSALKNAEAGGAPILGTNNTRNAFNAQDLGVLQVPPDAAVPRLVLPVKQHVPLFCHPFDVRRNIVYLS